MSRQEVRQCVICGRRFEYYRDGAGAPRKYCDECRPYGWAFRSTQRRLREIGE